MDIALVAGLWLTHSVWSPVATELERLGHRPMLVPLPGADDGSTTATLDDQLAAVLAVVDSCERPMVVGHSAASSLAWLVADRRPRNISRAVMIGGFPAADGATYADFFPTANGVMPFPGWEAFEGPDSDDLDTSMRERLSAEAVAVPESVSKGVVALRDDRRFDVPVTLVCPEFTPEQAQQWIAAGDVPELARARTVSFVDIATGHWPMVSQPLTLAATLDRIATPPSS
jgi:pimeloyl-ACP methyl ester carboxylesterase